MGFYVEMIPVSSSFIRAVGYDGSNLYVEMHTGQTYTHPKVPYYHFEELINADSPGGYYNHYVRGKYS